MRKQTLKISFHFSLAVIALGSLVGCGFAPHTVAQMKEQMGEKGMMYGYAVKVEEAEKSSFVQRCSGFFDAARTAKPGEIQPGDVEYNEKLCSSLSEYHMVSINLYGQWGNFVKGAVLTPKSAKVGEGDIVRYFHDVSVARPAEFRGIAARASERQLKNCDWVGSKTWNMGGVECEGYSYKNLPAFKS